MITDLAICLRKYEYSKTSLIVTLFCRRAGLVRLIAKGAYRRTKAGYGKYDGGLDVGDLGQGVMSIHPHKDLSLITEWTQLDGYLSIRSNYRSLMLANFCLELTSQLFPPLEPHLELFDALAGVLGEIGGPTKEQQALWYCLKATHISGFLPDFNQCGSCGMAADAWPKAPAKPHASRAKSTHQSESALSIGFDLTHGVMICPACRSAHPGCINLHPTLLHIVRMLLTVGTQTAPSKFAPRGRVFPWLLGTDQPSMPAKLPQLTRHQTDPLFALLHAHIANVIDRPMRSAPFILPAGQRSA
jgi:DNA repair protein RecO